MHIYCRNMHVLLYAFMLITQLYQNLRVAGWKLKIKNKSWFLELKLAVHWISTNSILNCWMQIYWCQKIPASLIITDFIAMVSNIRNSPTAYSCRGWARFKHSCKLISSCHVILITSYRLNLRIAALFINCLYFQFGFALSLCRVCFANHVQISAHFFKHSCLRAISL